MPWTALPCGLSEALVTGRVDHSSRVTSSWLKTPHADDRAARYSAEGYRPRRGMTARSSLRAPLGRIEEVANRRPRRLVVRPVTYGLQARSDARLLKYQLMRVVDDDRGQEEVTR